jgi:hypothetical protein
MAKRSRVFELDVDPNVASRAVREAIRGAGWEYSELGDHVEARESTDRLSCRESPVKVGIHLHQDDAERVAIHLDGWVAGWGPIANRQLPDRLRMLERTIRERCASVS